MKFASPNHVLQDHIRSFESLSTNLGSDKDGGLTSAANLSEREGAKFKGPIPY